MRLQTRRNGGTLTRPPRSAALFGHRGVDFCNVRVSFRPRTVFSLVLLTLGHGGLLAALVWGPLGYLLLWRRWPYGGLLGPALLPPDLHLLRGITFRGLPFMKYLIPPLERLGGPALRLRGQGIEDALKNGVGPFQFCHRQDHIDQLALVILVLDDREQQLVLFRQLFTPLGTSL